MRPDDSDADCGCKETRKRRKLLRWALLLAGLSLAAYMPYKAIASADVLEKIYGPWFLQGMVVAVTGVLFIARPSFAARLPLILRMAVFASALLWMRTGLACTPHLLEGLSVSLGPGLFAWFHMLTQHVFLALGVAAIAAAPRPVLRYLGADLPAADAPADAPVAARSV